MYDVIFDLDGTLWDATEQTRGVWNRVFERHPEIDVRVTPSAQRALMGRTMPEIGAALFPGTDPAFQRAVMDEIGRAEVAWLLTHGGALYEGVGETLHALRGTRQLYIVSNCQDGYVQAFMDYHGLRACFEDFEMSGRTGLDKPDNLRLLMARNGVDRAAYVGDTRGDEAAAAAAGIPFVHAAYGFGRAESPDAAIRALPELPAALRRMEAAHE